MATELIKYDAACRAIAAARSVDEVKRIRDHSRAIKAAARIANNRQMEVDATEIRARAERRLGQMLDEAKANGQRATQGTAHKKVTNKLSLPPTLGDVGIDANLANRARKLAKLSDTEFERATKKWRKELDDGSAPVTASIFSIARPPEYHDMQDITPEREPMECEADPRTDYRSRLVNLLEEAERIATEFIENANSKTAFDFAPLAKSARRISEKWEKVASKLERMSEK